MAESTASLTSSAAALADAAPSRADAAASEGKVDKADMCAAAAAAWTAPDIVSRSIVKRVESREQAEGAGARVRRSIGRPELRNLDPFLMLDEFKVGKPAGFPDHPHRGFETVTYMLEGRFMHEDFTGHKGEIGPGDLQWMTAGRGILHCEMPMSKEPALGLQLWVNLRATDKMCEPAYQELLKEEIPSVDFEGVNATVIAGSAFGVDSPVYTRTPTSYLDFRMSAGSSLSQLVPAGWNGFVYVLSGQASFGPEDDAVEGPPHHTLVLSNEDGQTGLAVRAGDEGCRFVLICGEPIGEPIVQHGPFVMNSREEIMQAMMDYQTSSGGFEGARKWASEAVSRMESRRR